MAALRDPVKGCPWDREQDFRSIVPYTIEEAYEVADAIDRADIPRAARRTRRSAAAGRVSRAHGRGARRVPFRRRRRGHHRKAGPPSSPRLRRRADRLGRRAAGRMGSAEGAGAGALSRGTSGSSAEWRLALPALARAAKLGRRAASVGFDWPDLAGVTPRCARNLRRSRRRRRATGASGGGDRRPAVRSRQSGTPRRRGSGRSAAPGQSEIRAPLRPGRG